MKKTKEQILFNLLKKYYLFENKIKINSHKLQNSKNFVTIEALRDENILLSNKLEIIKKFLYKKFFG